MFRLTDVPASTPRPDQEEARLATLDGYEAAVGRDPQDEFDHLVALAADLFKAPIALVSLVARDHQWFKAKVGLDACQTSREVSFCAYAIEAIDDVFVVPDALLDNRFATNPLVTDDPHIRFYAGAPLITPEGHKLGSFCVIDRVPRPHGLSARERRLLVHLARLAIDRLELRRVQHICAVEQEQTQAFLDAIVENVPASLFVKDAQTGRYLLLNRAAEELTGVPRSEFIGKTDHDVFNPAEAALFTARDQRVIETGELVVAEETIASRERGVRNIVSKKLALHSENGVPSYLLGFAEDVTDRKQADAQVAHMARHDQLTGLGNRGQLREHLRELISVPESRFALLKIDLDRFRVVNETLGAAAGDAVIKSVAERLRKLFPEVNSLFRLEADRFAVVCPSKRPIEAEKTARHALSAIAGAPFWAAGEIVKLTASVGIAGAPSDGDTPDALTKAAEQALKRAKSEGGAECHFFEAALDATIQRRRTLESDLRRAFDGGELQVHYQPLVSVRTAEIIGAEALLRWPHPERGMISPAEFIPVAEEANLIAPIGDWVMHQACKDAVSWPGELKVAVNLSPVQLRKGGVMEAISSALQAAGLDPNRLELEITEAVLMSDDAATLTTLKRVRELGARIAMDDFGTGFSSLSYLQRFAFDKIKVDQSFVRAMVADEGAMAIVRAVTGLGQALGIITTVEGVETSEQHILLKAVGCDQAQGFLFSPAVPVGSFVDMLQKGTSSQAA